MRAHFSHAFLTRDSGMSWIKIAKEPLDSWTRRRSRWRGLMGRGNSCSIRFSQKTRARQQSSRTRGTLSSRPLTGKARTKHRQNGTLSYDRMRIFSSHRAKNVGTPFEVPEALLYVLVSTHRQQRFIYAILRAYFTQRRQVDRR